MTEKTLIYLVGAPGSGKSTLMADLTSPYERTPAPSGLPRDWLHSPVTGELTAVEIGRRRENFSGTDALGQTIIGTACDWIDRQTEAALVFGEGARLGCRRFLQHAVDAGYAVLLGHLDHPFIPDWRAERDVKLARSQNPSWVRGRATAARNLAENAPDGVRVVTGHPAEICWPIHELIHERHHL